MIDDPLLITEHEHWHKAENGWPGIRKSIPESAITAMEISGSGNRLFMIMKTDDGFSFERNAATDAAGPKVQEWERLMWDLQKPLPWAKEGEKWLLMKKTFSF